METNHTPGPWKVGGGRYLPITAMVKGKSAQIGRAESFGQISDEECEANARLIAAAPELLKALEEAHNELIGLSCYLETCDAFVMVENLPSLISSARGKAGAADAALRKAKAGN
jgi:hypothetical protein